MENLLLFDLLFNQTRKIQSYRRYMVKKVKKLKVRLRINLRIRNEQDTELLLTLIKKWKKGLKQSSELTPLKNQTIIVTWEFGWKKKMWRQKMITTLSL